MNRTDTVAGGGGMEPAGSDDLFRTVFETLPTGILLINPSGRMILGMNPAACGLSGYDENELAGHPITEFIRLVHPGDTSLGEILGRGNAVEALLLDVNGAAIPVLLNPSRAPFGKTAVMAVSLIDLRDRMNEKAILLRELHHRVKNNMQLITGILHMEGMKIKDPLVRILFENSKNRILALAAIHEIAYRSDDFAHIPAGALINTITSHILSTRSCGHGAISPDIEAGTATLDLDAAVPFGILINELVSNSAMHAFPGGRDGTIQIRYRSVSDTTILEYCDDGAGFPPGVDFCNPATTGLELIRGLTGEMNGTVELQKGPGTRYRFTFPETIKGAGSS